MQKKKKRRSHVCISMPKYTHEHTHTHTHQCLATHIQDYPCFDTRQCQDPSVCCEAGNCCNAGTFASSCCTSTDPSLAASGAFSQACCVEAYGYEWNTTSRDLYCLDSNTGGNNGGNNGTVNNITRYYVCFCSYSCVRSLACCLSFLINKLFTNV